MQKTRPYRSYSLPVVMRAMKVKCDKCDNQLSEGEKCPCMDDVHPVKIKPKMSLQRRERIMSQPILEVNEDNKN